MASDTDNFEDVVKSRGTETVAEFDGHSKGFIGFLHDKLHKYPFLVPLVVIIAAVIVFGLINPNFWRAGTLSLILQQVGIVGILGIAQGIIIITAGIDLSVGAMLVFITSIIIFTTAYRWHVFQFFQELVNGFLTFGFPFFYQLWIFLLNLIDQ